VKKVEIIDGCPSREDTIPFRIPLKGIKHVSPTLKNVFNKFSVKYFIKFLIAIREEEENKSEMNEAGE